MSNGTVTITKPALKSWGAFDKPGSEYFEITVTLRSRHASTVANAAVDMSLDAVKHGLMYLPAGYKGILNPFEGEHA